MIFKLFLVFIFTIVILRLVKKFLIFHNFTGEKHQIFLNSKKIPLVGGIILCFALLICFETKYLYVYLFLISIFLLGLFSDLKKISSPILRFILQFSIVLFFVNLMDLKINPLSFYFLDIFLNNSNFNFFFTSFCILIILNGSNFLDGLNNLVIGYFIIISFSLKYLAYQGFLISSIFVLDYLILVLTLLFILNFFNKIYLGDSGAYLLSIFFSIILIDFYNLNSDNISPFFIVLLLWYPAFENFFSILRKIIFNFSPVKPDTFHLHQQIYKFLYYKFNKSSVVTNTLTGNLINVYNSMLILIGIHKISSDSFQIILVLISIIFYIFLYIRLIKKN